MVVRLSDFLNTSFSTFSANDTNNTGITYPGAVVHNTTLTPGVGIGAGLDYQVETTNNNTETGMRLETVTTDVTAGSEDFDFVIKLMQNGATASEKVRVTSTGNVAVTGTVNASSYLVNGVPLSGAIATSDTAPSSPTDGNLWWNSNSGKLFVYYDDGSSLQWVEIGLGTTFNVSSSSAGVVPRVSTITSSATPTINTDTVDVFGITALTVDITSFTTNLTGTPANGQKLWIYIVGTAARAITWGASFEASTVALPTTTVSTNRLDVGFVWNAATSKWRCVGSV